MDPSQLLAFFERATGSSLDLTKESLEKIVQNVDEDGDGLVRFSPRGDRSPEMYPIDVEEYGVHWSIKKPVWRETARQPVQRDGIVHSSEIEEIVCVCHYCRRSRLVR